MDARGFLQGLRDGDAAKPADLRAFARALGDGGVSDAQAGAFAMAVCLAPLSEEGRVALTLGMRDSGDVLAWDLPGPVIDKHSTGGVGDAVSLLLAPMLAVVGGYVPMISGRGLGHTGGTLDKLEAIPGFRTDLDADQFRTVVADIGCAIVAPSPRIAPADKRLYAARDVTGTVKSEDLITSSILSKKLAAGLDALVLDVKIGSGAIMQDEAAARMLATSLVQTANGAGCPTVALLTDMNQPLLPACGNALEVAEVMRAFDAGTGRLVDVALALGAALMEGAGLPSGTDALRAALTDGSAKARFGDMVAAQGGPENFADRWQDYLNIAPAWPVPAPKSGYITAIDGTMLGQIVVALGGGRQRETDRIDHSVGLSEISALGAKVSKGEPIAMVHARDEKAAREAAEYVQDAIEIGVSAPEIPALILDRISG